MNRILGAAMILGLAAIAASYSALRAQGSASRSVWDGVYTQAQAERGARYYEEQCERCHGKMMDGDPDAPPLAGSMFLAAWDGEPLGKLFVRIDRDMADNNAGKLNGDVNAAILAYILAFNDFPAGQTDLSHSAPQLNQILFEASRPNRRQ